MSARFSMAALRAAALGVAMLVGAAPTLAAEGGEKPPSHHWSFDGFFGTYDRAQLQRGWQVYKQVCAGCHALSLVAYRKHVDAGITPEQAAEIAAQDNVIDGPNDAGEMFERPARLSDRVRSPFPNEKAARAANNGAYPPDLSLMTKARANGPNYVAGLLAGYSEPPTGVTVAEGMYYNKYFPNHQIAMPPPLQEGGVSYEDGTAASIDNMAKDVTAFLQFAADPHLEDRKRTGAKVILFLLVLTAMLYAVKRKVWAAIH
jgi:ubiquinol-cytochrome c reductase cytochrome c1 subunit